MRTPFLLAAAFAASAALPAQPQPQMIAMLLAARSSVKTHLSEAEQEARAFCAPQLSGQKLAKAVSHVAKELAWQTSLEAAAKLARAQGKPIVWIQALGTLKGFL